MKAYTNIKQSKKLAEILPIESADMSWAGTGLGKPFARTIPCKGYPEEICPCWSLAALLQTMPQSIDDRYELTLGKLSGDNGWYVCYEDVDCSFKHYIANSNLIDACAKMILKLKEKNLL